MTRLNLSQKIIMPVIIGLLLTIFVIVFMNIRRVTTMLEENEAAQLTAANEAFISAINAKGDEAVATALMVASMPNVERMFALENREGLIDALHTAYRTLDEQMGVPQAQFHLPPATSFLRLHKLGKFGDDLSSFRGTVLAVNKTQLPVKGLEKGKGGYGIRGVVPVFYQSKHIGSFEIGLAFDENILQAVKTSNNVDLSVFLNNSNSNVDSFSEENAGNTANGSNFELYLSTEEGDPPIVDEAVRQAVFDSGEPAVVYVVYQGNADAIMVAPVQDYAGTVVGLVEIAKSRDAVLASMAETRRLALMIGILLSVMVGGTLWFIIQKWVIKPLQNIVAVSKKVAEGDVNVSLPSVNSHDEIATLTQSFQSILDYLQETASVAEKIAEGDLSVKAKVQSENDVFGKAFQTMITNLRAMIEQVVDIAAQVHVTAEQSHAASKQSGAATEQVAKTVQDVAHNSAQQAAGMEQATETVRQVTNAVAGVAQGAQEQSTAVTRTAELTLQLTQIIEQVADGAQAGAAGSADATATARDGSDTMDNLAQGMQDIRTTVSDLALRVQEMNSRSEQIGDIVATIENIAAQTNLLALNAAIEAARAGEHGKGFAVVADEVRKLAEKSAIATREIAGLVEGIQETSAQALKAMQVGDKAVTEGVEQTDAAGQALASILQASEAVNRQVSDIAVAAEQMNNSASELMNGMETVSAVIEENTAATEEMSASTAEVLAQIEAVSTALEGNAAAVEEISAASEEMNAQVEEGVASAETLYELSQTLEGVVSKFSLAD